MKYFEVLIISEIVAKHNYISTIFQIIYTHFFFLIIQIEVIASMLQRHPGLESVTAILYVPPTSNLQHKPSKEVSIDTNPQKKSL
jgi:hypothetical protein